MVNVKAYFKRLFEDLILALASEKYGHKLLRERMARED